MAVSSMLGVEVPSDNPSEEKNSVFEPTMLVVGIGGGGGNAVTHMSKSHIDAVKTMCINTDAQALSKTQADIKLQIGCKMTGGLGCGADPTKGKAAAEENMDDIRTALQGFNIVFITAGEGGGTGTGGAPVVAQIAKEMGILSFAIVTKPFSYEGKTRAEHAEAGIKELAQYADALIVIPNDKLLKVLGKKVTVLKAFAEANDVLLKAVRGISGALMTSGTINLDYNDLKRCTENGGNAIIGIGSGTGPERAQNAVQQAIVCPLLDDVDLKGAHSVFLNLEVPNDVTMEEMEYINATVKDYAAPNAEIITGLTYVNDDETVPETEDGEPVGEIRVTVIATGVGHKNAPSATINMSCAPVSPVIDIDSSELVGEDSPFFQNGTGTFDDASLDSPTFFRKQAD
ncbi:MAG: cell division protein FtsZ [Succinivibrionaceae bacterium]